MSVLQLVEGGAIEISFGAAPMYFLESAGIRVGTTVHWIATAFLMLAFATGALLA